MFIVRYKFINISFCLLISFFNSFQIIHLTLLQSNTLFSPYHLRKNTGSSCRVKLCRLPNVKSLGINCDKRNVLRIFVLHKTQYFNGVFGKTLHEEGRLFGGDEVSTVHRERLHNFTYFMGEMGVLI